MEKESKLIILMEIVPFKSKWLISERRISGSPESKVFPYGVLESMLPNMQL